MIYCCIDGNGQDTAMSWIRCAVGWTELGCATEISIDTITFVCVYRSYTKGHVASESYCIVKHYSIEKQPHIWQI
jgi:hypothetical protein